MRWVQHETGQRIFIGPGTEAPLNVHEVVIVFDLGGITKEAEQKWRDHAEHIVACVNACIGIPTEALKEGAVKELAEALEPFAKLNVAEEMTVTPAQINKARAALANFTKEEG